MATTRKSIDLTTLSGWSALSAGNHTITIIAKATGYINSAESASITVTKQQTTPTEDELAGNWVFNNTINTESTVDMPETFSVSFSDYAGTEYSQITFEGLIPETGEFAAIRYDDTVVYVIDPGVLEEYPEEAEFPMWMDENYQVINIGSNLDEVVDGDRLLSVMENNATKRQGSATRIYFTIGGVEYYALPGMTWGEFADSGDYGGSEFFTYNNTIVTSNYNTVQYNGVNVTPADIIQYDANYTLSEPGSGSSGSGTGN